MAYKLPTFNMWFHVVKGGTAQSLGYVFGQLRAAHPSLFVRLGVIAESPYDFPYVEVLVPAGSDVRTYAFRRESPIPPLATEGDQIIPLGGTNCLFEVKGVFDIGPGFANESRVALCQTKFKLPRTGDGGMYRLNPDLVPPPGFMPLPVLPRAT